MGRGPPPPEGGRHSGRVHCRWLCDGRPQTQHFRSKRVSSLSVQGAGVQEQLCWVVLLRLRQGVVRAASSEGPATARGATPRGPPTRLLAGGLSVSPCGLLSVLVTWQQVPRVWVTLQRLLGPHCGATCHGFCRVPLVRGSSSLRSRGFSCRPSRGERRVWRNVEPGPGVLRGAGVAGRRGGCAVSCRWWGAVTVSQPLPTRAVPWRGETRARGS